MNKMVNPQSIINKILPSNIMGNNKTGIGIDIKDKIKSNLKRDKITDEEKNEYYENWKYNLEHGRK